MPTTQPRRSHLRVVLFSGGRGSGALSSQLVANPQIALTIAINGYDDGASTGEIRRFLGDALGPSDFRKNASRIATELGTSQRAPIELLDRRLPDSAASRDLTALAEEAAGSFPAVAERRRRFIEELQGSGRAASGALERRHLVHQALDLHAPILLAHLLFTIGARHRAPTLIGRGTPLFGAASRAEKIHFRQQAFLTQAAEAFVRRERDRDVARRNPPAAVPERWVSARGAATGWR